MIDRPEPARNYLSRIRGVAMLPQERVAEVFSLEEGLIDEPISSGRMLIATSHRILFFRESGNDREATMLPVEELKGVVVSKTASNAWSPIKGVLTTLAALAFYFVVAYWLAGVIDGPLIPGLNMDFLPFALLVAVAVAAWLYWRHNLRRAGGQLTLHGPNWNLTFDISGPERLPDLDVVVERIFHCRQNRYEELYGSRVP